MWCMLFIIQIGCELPNELKPGERPEVTTSMPQDAYDAAKEQLHQVDARIPNDIVEKAYPTILQYKPSSGIRPFHLLRP